MGDASSLVVAKGDVEVLQTLGSGAFEEVIDDAYDDDSFGVAVDLETTEFDAVLELDVLDFGDLVLDFHERFVGEEVSVELFDLLGRHFLVQRRRDGRDDALEPRCDVRDKRDFDSIRR